MPRTRRASVAPASRLLALPRAAVSLLVLLAAVGGLPWLLWRASVTVVPAGVEGLMHLFTRQDTTSVALLALAVIGWIAWGSFLISVLIEIPAQLRGRSAPKLPGLHLSQRAAATLVGGILVLFTTGSALASASPSEAATITTTKTQLPGEALDSSGSPATTAQSAAAVERSAGQGTYTVRETRPAESLWSIAEQLYGDGQLYTRIAAANEGRTMADGTVFNADAPIRPGWILNLPDTPAADTGFAPQQAAARPFTSSADGQKPEGAAETYRVERGDPARLRTGRGAGRYGAPHSPAVR